MVSHLKGANTLKKRNREISIFNLSMLDVFASAMGAFLIIMVVLLPYYRKHEILMEEINDYKRQVKECKESMKELQGMVGVLETEVNDKKGEAERCNDAVKGLEGELRNREEEIKKIRKRLGFALKGKKIVFVVDISGSMKNDNKIQDVTAGIKMLVATMNENHETDILFFPNKKKSDDYGYLWGEIRKVTDERKYEIYRFLSGLSARGYTPTKSVLDFVFTNKGYDNADAVILLSDGVPTRNKNALNAKEIKALVAYITEKNNAAKVINTIGVGKDFRVKDSQADAVMFLRELAGSNNGFYVGF